MGLGPFRRPPAGAKTVEGGDRRPHHGFNPVAPGCGRVLNGSPLADSWVINLQDPAVGVIMARVFVATRIPGALAEDVVSLQRELDRRLIDVKWVEPENLHLTLRFFGELGEGEIERVVGAVTEVTRLATPFPARLEGIGTFPNHGRPRVIWAGMTVGRERLLATAEALERAFVTAGLGPADRPFAPHLTLGRVRDPRPPSHGGRRGQRPPPQAMVEMRAAVDRARFGPADFEVREIAVVQSRLSPRGPSYSDLHVATLGAPKT
jgi:2'-5' RNA ligase